MNVHIIVIYSSLNVEMQDWAGQTATNVVSEICGFLTILSGTILLHSTKESSDSRRSGISKCYKKSLVFVTSKVTSLSNVGIRIHEKLPLLLVDEISFLVRKSNKLTDPK
jgi:hypothetical protein